MYFIIKYNYIYKIILFIYLSELIEFKFYFEKI